MKEWNGVPAEVTILSGLTSRGQKQSLSITNTKFFKHCLPGVVRTARFSPVIVSGGTFVKTINEVAKIVYRDGMQYFLRINADSELLTPRWATLGIRRLQSMKHGNVGAIGPLSYNDRPDISLTA